MGIRLAAAHRKDLERLIDALAMYRRLHIDGFDEALIRYEVKHTCRVKSGIEGRVLKGRLG